MSKGIVFNIQKFSLHDGPGIRTVIFLKGCLMRCRWCSNPESQLKQPQIFKDYKKCIHCGLCTKIVCKDITLCPVSALSIKGEYLTVSQVVKKVIQDESFYKQSKGGVTLSGGEPLCQIDFVESLCEELHKKNICVAAETAGYSDQKTFNRLLNSIDIILYDIKHYNNKKHKLYTGVSNKKIINNLKAAVMSNKPLVVRIPVIPNFNDSINEMRRLKTLMKNLGVKQVDLLPFHQFGNNKYHFLSKVYEMENVKALHKENLKPYIKIFNKFRPKVKTSD